MPADVISHISGARVQAEEIFKPRFIKTQTAPGSLGAIASFGRFLFNPATMIEQALGVAEQRQGYDQEMGTYWGDQRKMLYLIGQHFTPQQLVLLVNDAYKKEYITAEGYYLLMITFVNQAFSHEELKQQQLKKYWFAPKLIGQKVWQQAAVGTYRVLYSRASQPLLQAVRDKVRRDMPAQARGDPSA